MIRKAAIPFVRIAAFSGMMVFVVMLRGGCESLLARLAWGWGQRLSAESLSCVPAGASAEGARLSSLC